jgi:hypothetical protein
MLGIPTEDGLALYLFCLRRASIDPPRGKLAGIAMRQVRSGFESGARDFPKVMRDRLAEAAVETEGQKVRSDAPAGGPLTRGIASEGLALSSPLQPISIRHETVYQSEGPQASWRHRA